MRLFVPALFALLLSFPAWAAEVHAIASTGSIKYPADFKAFDYVNSTAPKSGDVHIALTGTFDSLNPYILKGTPPPANFFNIFAFESLLYRSADEPFTMYPWVAESMELPEDRSTITFRINPKARWQDGQPITAKDLVFTYQKLLKEGRPNIRTYFGKIAKVEALDARSVRYIFKPKDGGGFDRELPLLVGLMPVLPEHALADKAFSQTTLQPLLGSGAYKVSAVDPGRKIVMEHVADYWAADLPALKGQQNFKTITLDFYRDDMVARQALLSGAADFKAEVDRLKLQKSYRGRRVDTGDVILDVVAHQRPEPYRGFVMNARRAPFDRVEFRHALVLAANFAQINQTLYGGTYQRSRSSFANSVLAAVPPEPQYQSPESYRANLLTARNELLHAGYTYKNEKLVDGKGQPVTFEILLVDSTDERISLAFARQLERLGIVARVRTVDSAQFQTRLNDFDYDVMVYRWMNSLSPGNEQLIYWGSKVADLKGSRNYPGVRDNLIDQAIAALLAAQNYEDVKNAARKIDQYLIDGNYVIPFFYSGADLFARSKRLERPATVPLTGYDIRTFWID